MICYPVRFPRRLPGRALSRPVPINASRRISLSPIRGPPWPNFPHWCFAPLRTCSRYPTHAADSRSCGDESVSKRSGSSCQLRSSSSTESSPSSKSSSQTSQIRKSRFLISTCHDVFRNLALEDWLYNNEDFANQDIILLWRNSRCVVIGRHQNPWSEVNLLEAAARDVAVARRRSGGGTVYHDLENLNVSFFTTRKLYDRKRNLSFLVAALKARWPHLDVEVNSRDDLVALGGQFKISGSSAKLGGETSYHHCTLLVDAELGTLRALLRSPLAFVENKATVSVPSPVINLHAIDPSLRRDTVIESIIDHWRNSIEEKAIVDKDSPAASFLAVDPFEEAHFPGIRDLDTDLRSWDWIFGRTPKFSVERRFSIEIEGRREDGKPRKIHLVIDLDKGKIKTLSVRPTEDDNENSKGIDEKPIDVVGGERDSDADADVAIPDLCQFLERRLNETLADVEFRSQVVSLYLANLANELHSCSRFNDLGNCTSQTGGEGPKTLWKKTVIMSLFDHITDLCLQ